MPIAMGMGMGISGGAAQAVAAPILQDQDQNHDQDYSKTSKGCAKARMTRHNRDHSKKRHFEKDQHQKSYEAGYQKGHSN
jgi:hypothetical protein